MLRLYSALALLLCSAASVLAQPVPLRFDGEQGVPFITAFSPDDYEAGYANWSAVQDSSGVLYIANNSSVLIFNGSTWMTLVMGSPALSLAIGPKGHVMVGSQDTFGYVARDSLGSLRYHALEDQLPEGTPVGTVWRITYSDGRAYFTGRSAVFWWDGEQAGLLSSPPDRLVLLAQVEDATYGADFDRGIVRVSGDSLVQVPGGEMFEGGPNLGFAIMPYPGDGLLIGTNGGELFVIRGGEATRLPTTNDALLRDNGIYQGIRLRDGNYALALRSNGFVIVAPDGELVMHLTKRHGLPDPTVLYVYEDQQGGLWALTRNGVALVEYSQPWLTYGELQGIAGTVEDLQRHEGRLYAGGLGGVKRLTTVADGAEDAAFTDFVFPGGQGNTMFGELTEADGQLLASGRTSVFIQSDGGFQELYADDEQQGLGTRAQVWSTHNPDVIYAAASPSFYTLRKQASGRWAFGQLFDDTTYAEVDTELLGLVEVGPGTILVIARNRGVYRVSELDTDAPTVTEVTGIEDVSTRLASAGLMDTGHAIYFHREGSRNTGPNWYRYDDESIAFVPDSLLGASFVDGRDGVFKAAQSEDGTWWLRLSEQRNAVAWPETDGSYTLDLTALSRMPNQTVTDIVPEGDSLVWFSTRDGLFRYDRRRAAPPNAPPPEVPSAHIFTAFTFADSTTYGGWYDGAAPLTAEQNALRFTYGWPYLSDLDTHTYQFRLVGSSDEWSAWTDETQKDYTNLPPGGYAFEVRARNRAGVVSAPASFAFAVAPRWYQTWWMRLLYALVAIGIVAAVTRYIAQLRLKRRLRQLEAAHRVQQERERISSDLHDHVGAQLSNIISAVELVHLSAEHGDADKMMRYLDGLDEDARGTMARLRETIWALHKDETSIAAFAEQVRKFARERVRYTEGLHAEVTLDAPQAAQHVMLRPTQALQLFRIAQEAISNAVKHAEADTLHVRLAYAADGQLAMKIQDDGAFKGPSTALNEGYGMQTMRDRAAQINANLTVSGSARGTEVAVQMPLEEDAMAVA
ncbi:MAG: histidine kinase [Bacteroidota bacterium]